MQWIGAPKITAELLPKTGDRDDFLIRAVGPGDTDYQFPLSMTGTILAIWNEESQKCAEALAGKILDVIGTAKAPPEDGFSFDSYNSENTLEATLNKVPSQGIEAFAKGGIENQFISQFGNDLFQAKQKIDAFFATTYGHDFFRSFEDAFEESEALQDLNDPPASKADFLYRICILSVFIDHFSIRKDDEASNTRSLQALRHWLEEQVGEEKSSELCKPFKMVKRLRKQYPIHESYEVDSDTGGRTLRRDVRNARAFFDVKELDYAQDWKSVVDKFITALNGIQSELEE